MIPLTWFQLALGMEMEEKQDGNVHSSMHISQTKLSKLNVVTF